MQRVRRGSFGWKQRWPWRLLFHAAINERVCPRCGLPYQDGALPEPEYLVEKGSLALCRYPAGSFRPKERVLRFVRWRSGSYRLYMSEFIPMEEFDCLREIVDEATLLLANEKTSSSKRQ